MTDDRPAQRPNPRSGPGMSAGQALSRGVVHPAAVAGAAGQVSRQGGKSRRPALASDHFSLTWRRSGAARHAAAKAVPAAIHTAPRLTMAVAKKLLPRAVDRNTVRRITREAWRAVAGDHPDLDLFVRLQTKPRAWAELPDGQRKRACRSELDALMARLPVAGAAR